MDVAIVGMSETASQAPFGTDWEMWGLPWDSLNWPLYDRLFEMHDMVGLEAWYEDGFNSYVKKLKDVDVTLYMQEKYFENVTPYPFKEVQTDYFSSSIAYMVALAISEGAKRIGLWGIDMNDTGEYSYQRPNIEYLLGMAKANGIEVIIPDESPLLKYNDDWNKSTHKYPIRYGLT